MMEFNSKSLIHKDDAPVNIEAINSLTKLFATEDLIIQHDPSATTASFNVKSRVLTLPAWKDLPKVIYLLFSSHESGHALFTPADCFDNPLIDKKKLARSGYMSVLNVVEDARIEKKVKRKYPGLRADFVDGYGRLMSSGFFGQSLSEIAANGNFIDRFNVRFKLGSARTSCVPFDNDDERGFVERGFNIETFDDAVRLANDIYDYLCENEGECEGEGEGESGRGTPGEETEIREGEGEGEGEPVDGPRDDDDADGESGSSGDSDSDDETEGDSDSGDDGESEAEGEGDSDESDESDADGDSPGDDADESADESDPDTGEGGSGSKPPVKSDDESDSGSESDSDPGSETDKASRNNAEDLVDSRGGMTKYYTVPFDRVVTDHFVDKTEFILSEFDGIIGESHSPDTFRAELTRECKKYITSCNPVVSYLAKEFEMKKAAAQHARVAISRTGVIDTKKLHAYKFSEELFLRKAILPDSKNHGLVMFVDLSGSMQANMAGTLEQLINLVLFCKKVQIPFEVYGFGDSGYRSYRRTEDRKEDPTKYIEGDVLVDPTFYLRKYVSHDLKPSVFKRAIEYLYFMRLRYDTNGSHYSDHALVNNYGVQICGRDELCSTPLNDAIITADGIVKEFVRKTAVQICNVVFLTDGESNPLHYARHYDESGVAGNESFGRRSFSAGADHDGFIDPVLRDEKTKKVQAMQAEGRYGGHDHKAITAFLLDSLAKRNGVKIAGFFVVPSGIGRNMKRTLAEIINGSDTSVYRLPDAEQSNLLDRAGEAWDIMKKEGVFVINDQPGYDVHFIIRGGDSLKTNEDDILSGLSDNEKVATVRRAFKNGSKKKIKSRVLLTKFIDLVS